MLGNFTYHNPTTLYFGSDALENLTQEINKYGKNVLLVYGSGSIKRNGVYAKVMDVLQKAQCSVSEIEGVMPNPTLNKLYEGIEIARKSPVDLILAVGGGSVCDYAKALSVSIFCKEDPWQRYYVDLEEPDCPIVPVGCVLTMAGTGSEMNAGAVITNTKTKEKIGHVFADPQVMPRFSILNPEYTMSLPFEQMTAGIYDIFNHICEQYFSGDDDNTSDYISEGLMRSLLVSSRQALQDPKNYEARSNIMWTATWALNTLVAKGKSTDWMVHMLGQAVGALTNATHGKTLSAVSMAYYRSLLPYGLEKFKRFAICVWGIDPTGKTDQEIASEGLDAMEAWIQELKLPLSIAELGVDKTMIDDLVDRTLLMEGGYHVLSKEEIRAVYIKSL